MKLINPIFYLFFAFLTSCSFSDISVEKQMAEIDIDDVTLYYTAYPSCKYTTVGYIEINGSYFSKQSIFYALKEHAAEMGANGVVVDYLEQLDMKEYVSVAQAIHCQKTEMSSAF